MRFEKSGVYIVCSGFYVVINSKKIQIGCKLEGLLPSTS